MHCRQMKMLILTSGLIALVLVFSFMLQVPHVHAQTACDYYASPNGTGNGLSPSTPFQISKFWSYATPGKTLCLLDGTYTGGNSMIRPPSTFAGTAGQPITIRAMNDGAVLIDGGSSRPVSLRGAYGILEGVNIHGGDNITLSLGGQHWIVRRVVAWNTLGQGVDHIIDVAGTHGLLEDCAAFGKARKILAAGAGRGGPGYNTVRRCWARWEDKGAPGVAGNPTNTLEMGYGQDNVTFENVLAIRDVAPGAYVTSPEKPFTQFATKNSKWLGSIVYLTPTAKLDTNALLAAFLDGGSNYQNGQYHTSQGNLWQDVVAFVSPGHPNFHGIKAMGFTGGVPAGTNNTIINLVGVGGAASTCDRSSWNGCGNLRLGTSLSAALGTSNSVWTEVPGICKRYVDGKLTNAPLWPWPMNQRIKDALVQSGRSPVDVTRTMEDMFGPIAQACKTGTTNTGATPAPSDLRVIGAN